ncbi:MotA/TolQ/ExbB proton channel family protein [Candidatus Rhodobacter oscarellae]|uniref:MotA/TolQ/ExbB proton channel family protein n=1 Tax=Candidatus Rhodobacter oscarellae TaxID=1675527 RepID=A0A0J9E2S8_9RHOB|nr:hypothetical protein [Candidatus Rhodobacter lobularis]KMW56084.1 MotA/TolQ/ExbB proton channel family protein [Candidatus Rhodobacter lobularis]
MDQPDREAEQHFTQPWRQIVLMSAVLALVGALSVFLFPSVAPTFLANPWLNGFILAVFVVGVFACYWQTWQLRRSTIWIESFMINSAGMEDIAAPRLLGPMATLLKSRGATMQINSTSARSILDSVATRIDELRDITRYIVNLLIFLGLLGTFYGLATAVPAIVDTIGNLEPKDGETGADVFRRLQSGLEAQMAGMGVAFASSLLGLAGSLVVGLLELFAGHGQNRFYRELEEWLSTITKLGFSTGDSDGGGDGDHGQYAPFFAHMSQQFEEIQGILTQADVSRSLLDERLGAVANGIEAMTAKLGDGDENAAALARIADGQARIADGQARMVQLLEVQAQAAQDGGGAGIDAESRMRLRSIDVQLLRILEEMAAGRQESTAELRGDIAALTKALRQTTRDPATTNNRRG